VSLSAGGASSTASQQNHPQARNLPSIKERIIRTREQEEKENCTGVSPVTP
jgi:hypothetical protein